MLQGFLVDEDKFDDGVTLGAWIDFPIDDADFENFLETYDIEETDGEYFFIEWKSDPEIELSTHESIDELNEIAEKLDSEVMCAVLDGYGKADFMETDEEDWFLYPDINTEYDLGYYWIEDSGVYSTDEKALNGPLANYITFDYEAFGRDITFDGNGVFTSYGWLERA